jgi:hypothetical protein
VITVAADLRGTLIAPLCGDPRSYEADWRDRDATPLTLHTQLTLQVPCVGEPRAGLMRCVWFVQHRLFRKVKLGNVPLLEVGAEFVAEVEHRLVSNLTQCEVYLASTLSTSPGVCSLESVSHFQSTLLPFS